MTRFFLIPAYVVHCSITGRKYLLYILLIRKTICFLNILMDTQYLVSVKFIFQCNKQWRAINRGRYGAAPRVSHEEEGESHKMNLQKHYNLNQRAMYIMHSASIIIFHIYI